MFGCISAVIIGFLCGLIARFLLPGSDSMGMVMTTLVGIAGAYVGTLLGQATGRLKQNDKAGWVWSILGSMIVLAAMRWFF